MFDLQNTADFHFFLYISLIAKGRYFFSGGGAGASEGRVISESEHQKGRAIQAIQGRVTHLLQNFLMRIFVMLLSIFLTDKVFLFTYFDLIWCFIIGTRLHFYMYIMPWHIVFLGGLVSFSVRIEEYLTQVSFLQLLAVGYPLPDLLSRLVLKSY